MFAIPATKISKDLDILFSLRCWLIYILSKILNKILKSVLQ